jgi:uncharacterized FlaG/YvyC family protein
MSSLNGIDPIIVDTIKIQTQKQMVNETKKSKISKDKQERQGYPQENDASGANPRKDLPAAINRLNQLLEENDIPLFFQINPEKKATKTVQLISYHSQEVIKEFYPEQVFKMLKEFSIRGFTINELI